MQVKLLRGAFVGEVCDVIEIQVVDSVRTAKVHTSGGVYSYSDGAYEVVESAAVGGEVAGESSAVGGGEVASESLDVLSVGDKVRVRSGDYGNAIGYVVELDGDSAKIVVNALEVVPLFIANVELLQKAE